MTINWSTSSTLDRQGTRRTLLAFHFHNLHSGDCSVIPADRGSFRVPDGHQSRNRHKANHTLGATRAGCMRLLWACREAHFKTFHFNWNKSNWKVTRYTHATPSIVFRLIEPIQWYNIWKSLDLSMCRINDCFWRIFQHRKFWNVVDKIGVERVKSG